MVTETVTTMDALTAYRTIERQAQILRVRETRVIERMTVGQVVRQGDIYLHRVHDSHRHGHLIQNPQLAGGQGGAGQHMATGAKVRVYAPTTRPKWVTNQTTPMGPCVVADDRWVVTHPEHAHVSLPAGTYQVTHQMDPYTHHAIRD